MRESLAHALSGPISLAEDEWRERPVDRLHALASAQIERANRAARESHLASLGVSLVALRDANRADEYARTVDKLTRLIKDSKPKAGVEWRTKISRQAVQEVIISFCPRCHGAKEIPAQDDLEGAQRMVPCPEDGGCGGTGKRRYTDQERLAALEADFNQVGLVNAHMAAAHAILAEAEYEAVKTAIRLLERW